MLHFGYYFLMLAEEDLRNTYSSVLLEETTAVFT